MCRTLSYFLILAIAFSSCEKNLDIKLDPTTTDLVVDATIENGMFPVVILSRSLDYFSEIDQQALASHFVHHATVTMFNGDFWATLEEDSVQPDVNSIMMYYYSFNVGDTNAKFVGLFNGQYKLNIQVENQNYTASTTIPLLVKKIDSLWWTPAPSSAPPGYVNVEAKITDPPGLGNYTRYFTKVNSQPFYPGLTSVFDDQVTDGTTYTVMVEQGVNRNNSIDTKTYGFFQRGDSVVVKFADIDKATYDFWRTMEYNYGSVGNPFSTPTEVLSNISNGALGYFGGYAAQYVPLIIPH